MRKTLVVSGSSVRTFLFAAFFVAVLGGGTVFSPGIALGADTCTPTGAAYSCEANVSSCHGTVDDSKTCDLGGVCCVAAAASAGTVNFGNPLGFSSVEAAMTTVLLAVQKIIVMLALVFLVIGAVLYIISAGEQGRIDTAKKAIFAAMIGLAIGVAAPSFLKEISGIFDWKEALPGQVQNALTLSQILGKVLTFLLSVVGTLSIIMMVIGGLMFIMAAGDQTRVDTAKKIVFSSLIGIAVAGGSLILVGQVMKFFVK